jgi:GGDEF domain-containing protein
MTSLDPALDLADPPLLPPRDAVLARLAELLAGGPRGGTLLVVGLLRRDEGWPLADRTRIAVTSMVARSLRAEDWFGSAGQAEFAVLTDAPPVAAVHVADRLIAGVAGLGIAGLCGAAGYVPLSDDADAAELLRRATLGLGAARRSGPGIVEPYRPSARARFSW